MRRKMRTVTEDIVLDKPMTVDRDAGVIHHVKICGRVSKHGYEYSQRALEEASQQYERVKVNIDHPPRDNPTKKRSFTEWFGKFGKGTVTVEDDGVYGDLHYLKSHPQANTVAEAAERMPDFGLSHVADVFENNVGGKRVVESMGKVRSVDVVCNPATNNTLFESEDHVPTLTIKQVLSRKKNKKFLPLLKVMEESEYADAAVEPTVGDAEMKPGSEEEMKAAFSSMIQAAFEDPELDMKETIRKVREIIKAYYKLSEEPEPEEEKPEEETETPEEEAENDDGTGTTRESDDEEEETVTEEAVDCKCKRLEAEIKARDILEEADVAITPSRVKAVVAMEDEDELKELVESFPKRGTSPGRSSDGLPTKRPRTATRMEEEVVQFPTDGKSFAAAIKQCAKFG